MARKDDFILMTRSNGEDVLINLNKIRFITRNGREGYSNFHFGSEKESFVTIKIDLEDFPELV
jgi:hypothetical protein